ncbi:MAG: biotin/lipoyl-binding protein [Candidatus Izemoplasmatales bacterium]|nr:biotin/lipoyl-binding protein [Candidatus Izemoplasmatales bacterium]
MKIYKINVNGKSYEVEVESIEETKPEKPVLKKEPVHDMHADIKSKVLAPMQGKIISLKIEVGSTVKKGDVLMILEAMKLENDILCPVDGYVRKLLVKENDQVEINQLMLIIG